MFNQYVVKVIFLRLIFVTAIKEQQLKSIPRPQRDITKLSTSPQDHDTVEFMAQAAPNTTVNWDTMPLCQYGICNEVNAQGYFPNGTNPQDLTETPNDYYNFPINCPIVEGICTSPNGTTHPCQTYDLDCYCGLSMQLTCSWYECSWFEWMLTEDWLQTQCPSITPVEFSAIPVCASSCVEEKSFSSGCISEGRNCFCEQGSIFGCDTGCDSDDVDAIQSWYVNECNVTTEDAQQIVGSGKIDASTHSTSDSVVETTGKIHWYEDIAVAAAVFSFVLLVVGLVGDPWLRRWAKTMNDRTLYEE
ncbi:hypothetical protein MMC13_000393 [Lambiella insularis]|nr:hypothetical protein [Lambiella insularis]